MKKSIGYVYVIAAAVCWGFLGLFNRVLTTAGVSLLNMMPLRFGGTAILFTVFCVVFKRQVFRIKLRHLPIFLGSGLISMLLLGLVYFRCQQLCSLAVASILMYLAPSFVVLFGTIFWKVPLTPRKITALLLALCGCALVSGIVGSDVRISLEGLLMSLASGLCYGGYTIFAHYGMRYYDSFTMAYWTFLIAGIASLFLADWSTLLPALAESKTGLAALGLMVVGTALPFTLYTKGLETVESGKAAIIANIEPVMSAVIGVTVFQETLGLWTLTGIILVLSGVVVLACEKEPDK